MKKWYLLKPFQELGEGGNKENSRKDEFKYDVFDTF
jgi:hypothetical protein